MIVADQARLIIRVIQPKNTMNRREILRTGSLGTLGLLATRSFQTARAQGSHGGY